MASEISKSAMTPSFIGLRASMVPGCSTKHPFCIGANRTNLLAAFVPGNHAWLAKHDATIPDEDQGVCSTQVYAYVI